MAADSSPALTKLVPGFEFLQGLVKNAGAAMPSVGQWVAPTLEPGGDREAHRGAAHGAVLARAERAHAGRDDPGARGAAHDAVDAEDDERADRRPARSMQMQAARRRAAAAAEPAARPTRAKKRRAAAADARRRARTQPAGVVDPMQWWGALTKQFTQLAAQAMKDGAGDAAKSFAGAVAKQSIDAAGRTLKKAASVPTAAARKAAGARGQPAAPQAHRRGADGQGAADVAADASCSPMPRIPTARRAGAGRGADRAQRARAARGRGEPTLGLVYFSDHYAAQAEALLDALRAALARRGLGRRGGRRRGGQRRRVLRRAGAGADAVRPAARAASRCSPARAPLDARSSLRRRWCTPTRPRTTWPTLIGELSERTAVGYLFGGLASSRARTLTSPTACSRAACRAWRSAPTWRWCRA